MIEFVSQQSELHFSCAASAAHFFLFMAVYQNEKIFQVNSCSYIDSLHRVTHTLKAEVLTSGICVLQYITAKQSLLIVIRVQQRDNLSINLRLYTVTIRDDSVFHDCDCLTYIYDSKIDEEWTEITISTTALPICFKKANVDNNCDKCIISISTPMGLADDYSSASYASVLVVRTEFSGIKTTFLFF